MDDPLPLASYSSCSDPSDNGSVDVSVPVSKRPKLSGRRCSRRVKKVSCKLSDESVPYYWIDNEDDVTVENPETLDLFWRYLYRRMVVRIHRHNDQTVLKEFPRVIPHDPILNIVTSGNVYRHMDTGTVNYGKRTRKMLPGYASEQWAGALMACLFERIKLNPDRSSEAIPDTNGIPKDSDDLRKIVKWMKKYEKTREAGLFADAGHQVQGYRWIQYFSQWAKNDNFLKIAECVRLSKTWKEANEHVSRLAGIGHYYGAQGLCTMVFGVFKGNFSACFSKSFDPESYENWCVFGPGPRTACQKMFSGACSIQHGIQWLSRHQELEFQRLGIDFPYLQSNKEGGRRRLMNPQDMEHSLCYFSRYLDCRRDHLPQIESLVWPSGMRLWPVRKLQQKSTISVYSEAATYVFENGPYTEGTPVRKFFPGHGWFDGAIAGVRYDCFNITYDDGDSEELSYMEDYHELREIVENATKPIEEDVVPLGVSSEHSERVAYYSLKLADNSL